MKKFMLLIALVFIAVIGAKAQTGGANDGPEIKFESVVHDYGTIKKGSDGGCVFKFKNVGNEVLVISDVRKSCGCTTPTWSKEPILPGQSGQINVGYNTGSVGQFNKTITVISNGITETVTLTIKGNVVE